MKTYWGSGGIAPPSLILGTRWGEMLALLSSRFTTWTELPVPIREVVVWAPERVWTRRVVEEILGPAGNRTPVVQPSGFTNWAAAAPKQLSIRYICNRLYLVLYASSVLLIPIVQSFISLIFVSFASALIKHFKFLQQGRTRLNNHARGGLLIAKGSCKVWTRFNLTFKGTYRMLLDFSPAF